MSWELGEEETLRPPQPVHRMPNAQYPRVGFPAPEPAPSKCGAGAVPTDLQRQQAFPAY